MVMDSRSKSKDKLFLPAAVRCSQFEIDATKSKNKRTEDSFEPKSPPFHLTFSSALIGRQSAPRAFHSRFPRRNRIRCKILPHAFGPRMNNLRACHTLRLNRATKSYHQSIIWLRLKRSWILIYFRLLRTQGINQRFDNPETSKFGEPRDI